MSSHDDDEVASASKRARQAKSQQEMSGRFNFPVGRHTFRILKTPGDKERNSPPLYMEYFIHNRVGPNLRFVRCGNEPGERGNCWLCRKADKLAKEGKTKAAAKLRAQKKMVLQIAFLDKEAGELVGPLLWTVTVTKKPSEKTPSHKLYNFLGRSNVDKYLDHKRGRNLTLRRVGEGLDTTYPEAIEAEDEKSRVPKEILKELRPFADADIRPYDEDYVKSAYYGTEDTKGENMAGKKKDKKKKKHGDEDLELEDDSSEEDESEELDDPSDDDDSDDESDDKKKKKKKKSKKSKDDSDDDDDDDDKDDDDSDDDDSDDDDESDKKKKKKKKKKSKKDDDDDSDDDDEDDEDDSSSKDDSEDDDEEEDESEEDESDEPKKKKKNKRKPRKKKKH